MLRSLDTFLLAPSHRTHLTRGGFKVAKDVLELSPLALAKELSISREEALEILRIVRGETPLSQDTPAQSDSQSSSSMPTALELLDRERSRTPITTFSANFDGLLSGFSEYSGVQKGVARGCVTEFCGAPGIGKTQLGMQLAISVQIPEILGGAEGEAIFIDTEGSFIVERVAEIAEAAVKHIQDMAASYDDPSEVAAAGWLSVDSLLNGIYYFRVLTYIEQIALIRQLSKFVAEHPAVRLIVLDSVAFHFRGGHKDMAQRTRLLHLMSQQLVTLAQSTGAAVVLTNQMTTKVNGDSSHLVPALGESWGHASTHRIIQYWDQGRRFATMYKSSSAAEATVRYDVTKDGIRDPPELGLPVDATARDLTVMLSQPGVLANYPLSINAMEDVALFDDDVYETEPYDDSASTSGMPQISGVSHTYPSHDPTASHYPTTSAGRQPAGTAQRPDITTAQQHAGELPSNPPTTRQPWRSAPIDSQEDDMAQVKRTRVHDH